MHKIAFTKMVASGNDFVVTNIKYQKSNIKNLKNFARAICDRKYGVGADGMLVLEKSKVADIKMRIFNADGSEAEMCGNGARCVALYVKSNIRIKTKAGMIQAQAKGDNVRIKLTDPKDIRLGIPLSVNRRALKVNYIDTGVPHTVIFVEGLDKIDVVGIGKAIRNHKKFAPRGTNVDFVEVLNKNSIKVRTYERGVEDETLACGTGSVAAALLATLYLLLATCKMKVYTKSGEILTVYFQRVGNSFKDVWLEGKARIVFQGSFVY